MRLDAKRIEVMTVEEFRKRASDCLRWAQEAANERTRALWLSMAQIWLNRAESAGRAAAAVDVPGRPLAAANAALPVPDRPHLALWQSLTTLREHRGDGHIAALMIEGDAAKALLATAAERSADLVVLGAVQDRSLADRLLGTVALEVAKRVGCDVLIVRPEHGEAEFEVPEDA